jgi:hypothetical protein
MKTGLIPSPCIKLRFERLLESGLNLAGVQAAHADLDVLFNAIVLDSHTLQVRFPAGTGLSMGMGNIIAVHRAFSADIAFSGHGFLQSNARLYGSFIR